MKIWLKLGLVLLCCTSVLLFAEEDYTNVLKTFAATELSDIVKNPLIQEAVKAQNEKHAKLTLADIKQLDSVWREERIKPEDSKLISGIMRNKLSVYLNKLKSDYDGVFTEIFVMDDKGLNVGLSDVTSDYWQGDEDKWQKTFSLGPGRVHIGELTRDESTRTVQVQLSMTISDTVTNKPIGAITIGINPKKI